MKSKSGLITALLFVNLFLVAVGFLLSATKVFEPIIPVIDDSFLMKVRLTAMLSTYDNVIAGLIFIAAVFAISAASMHLKNKFTDGFALVSIIFLVLSLGFCIIAPMKYAFSKTEVHTYTVEGKKEETTFSLNNLIGDYLRNRKRVTTRRRDEGIEVPVYYLTFDNGQKCPVTEELYDNAKKGEEFYVISIGSENVACYNTGYTYNP